MEEGEAGGRQEGWAPPPPLSRPLIPRAGFWAVQSQGRPLQGRADESERGGGLGLAPGRRVMAQAVTRAGSGADSGADRSPGAATEGMFRVVVASTEATPRLHHPEPCGPTTSSRTHAHTCTPGRPRGAPHSPPRATFLPVCPWRLPAPSRPLPVSCPQELPADQRCERPPEARCQGHCERGWPAPAEGETLESGRGGWGAGEGAGAAPSWRAGSQVRRERRGVSQRDLAGSCPRRAAHKGPQTFLEHHESKKHKGECAAQGFVSGKMDEPFSASMNQGILSPGDRAPESPLAEAQEGPVWRARSEGARGPQDAAWTRHRHSRTTRGRRGPKANPECSPREIAGGPAA